MRGRARRSREVNAEINITAFMNLMVVLVPFLLITAVFSQMSILELNLPAGAPVEQEEEKKPPIVLEVLIYNDRLEVVDRQTGPLKIIPSIAGSYDYKTLVSTLKAVKKRFPDITAITLLLQANTSYDVLVQTMDSVRSTTQEIDGEESQAELFPDISIGDAPPDTAGKAPATSSQGLVNHEEVSA
ncbi:MAG: biopolymer transporter ExbD [Pseudomonadales bacterium]|nr:biopolymer transporter ExbD [Pseudomonadales bacterium]